MILEVYAFVLGMIIIASFLVGLFVGIAVGEYNEANLAPAPEVRK